MKKKKLTFLTDIAVLVLCVCAIAIGVYSAKNASINIGGSVGFNAHDCKVRVLGKISGAYDKDGNKLTENNASATVLFADATDTTKGKLITGTSAENNWKFGNIYYNDLTAPNSYSLAEDIVFTFEITNESAYDVAFKVIKPTNLPDNIVSSITIDNNSQTEETENDATLLNKRGDKVTVVLTLRLGYEEDINTANNFNGMQFNFYKPSANDAVTTIDNNFRYQIYPATKTAVVTGLASNATELAIPDTITISGDTYTVKKIEASSFNDVNITSVEIPASVTSIGDYAFYGCTSLKQINIPSTVKHIGVEAFTGTPFLGEYLESSSAFVLKSFNTETCPNGIYTCTDSENKKIFLGDFLSTAQDTLPDLENVYLLADNAFNESLIETINLPVTLQYIGDAAFGGCALLTEINLPQELLTIGDNAFVFTGLTSVIIPSNVEQIGKNPFAECAELTSISVNSNNKYYASIGQKSLIEIESNTFITGLNNATIPDGIKTIGEYAFIDITNIPNVIPKSVTTIEDYAFSTMSDFELLDDEDELSVELLDITLPENLTYLGAGAFANRKNVKSINIPSLITTIYDSTFSNCENLETVTLNGKIKKIEDYAFEGTKISNITLSSTIEFIGKRVFNNTPFLNGLTDGVYTCADNNKILIKLPSTATTFTPSGYSLIADGAFEGCKELVTITIPDGATTVGGYAGCNNLKTVVLPDSVKAIEPIAFRDCSSLTSINIPNNVKSIGYNAFSGCSSLEEIVLPNSLSIINAGTFANCKNLKTIYIPETTTIIGGNAFSGCTSLKSITLPEKLIDIKAGLFKGCTSLSSITLPNNVISIGDSAFKDCSSLSSMTIPERVISIGSKAFYGCKNLTSLTIPNSLKSIADSVFGQCNNLSKVYITDMTAWCNIAFSYASWSNFNSNPLTFGADLYLNGNKVTDLVIPNDVKEIKQSAFYKYNALKTVILPNSVTQIGMGAFEGCSNLTTINIPSSVLGIGFNAFSSCNNLSKVNITDLTAWCNIDFSAASSNPLGHNTDLYLNGSIVESLSNLSGIKKIKQYAFYGYKKLTSVTILNDVTEIGHYAFTNCSNLTSVIIRSSVTSIGTNAFEGCTGLTSISLPDSISQINWGAFESCSNLKEVNISSIDKWFNINFSYYDSNPLLNGADLILNGSKVTEVVIPSGLKSIPKYVMYNYKGLTSLTIPANVTEIGDQAFYNCTNLDRVNITDLTAWEKIKFNYYGSNNPLTNNAGLYVNGEAITKLTINDDNFNYYAYSGCSTLTSAEYTYDIKKIPNYAFYKCSNIENIKLLDDSSLEVIGYYAFNGCAKLKTINIPSSVYYVGSDTGLPKTNGMFECTDGKKILLSALSTVPEGVYLIASCLYDARYDKLYSLPSTLKYISDYLRTSRYYWTDLSLTINSKSFYRTTAKGIEDNNFANLGYSMTFLMFEDIYIPTDCETIPDDLTRTYYFELVESSKEGYLHYNRVYR